ncbi:hypothetical protein AAGR22_13985 [Erwinia sp. HDF1-3R]|uniref:hypothetical protein n=1 Tax=Erwinia sp. HDF1-3R TaxID=3141543 RepID=UPI0031F4D1A8
MTPRFTLIPPGSLRVSLIVTLLTLPSIAGIGHAWYHHKQLTSFSKQIEQRLRTHQQAARTITDKIRRLQTSQPVTMAVMTLLDPLGRALSDEVLLQELDASIQQQQVRINVVAKSLPALLDFSARLQRIPAQVELQNHRTSADKNSQWPLSATLSLNMMEKRGAGRE